MSPSNVEEEREEKVAWLALTRLVYCMERQEEPMPGQSWQSLLLRAQHCQDLWDQQAEAIAAEDPELYDHLSRRVDQACRRAHEVAEHFRQRSQPSNSLPNDSPMDWVDQVFFTPEQEDMEADAEPESNDEVPDDLAELLDEDDTDSDSERPSSTAVATNVQDLQQTQREQMEEAIGLMAQQMKEATQGIHSQLQQQTQQTISELETVAEQNVQDVSQVAQNVQEHNQATSTRNWGTWTLMFTIAGIFLFLLVTIFTVPKRPNTCLFLCRSGGDATDGTADVSLLGWIAEPILLVAQSAWILVNRNQPMDQDEKAEAQDDNERWNEYYSVDQEARLQQEQLTRELNKLQGLHDEDDTNKEENQWGHADRDVDSEDQGDEEEDDDNIFGRRPLQHGTEQKDKNPNQRAKDSAAPSKAVTDEDVDEHERVDGTSDDSDVKDSKAIEEDEEEDAGPLKPQDIDMAELMASLSNAAKKAKEEGDMFATPNPAPSNSQDAHGVPSPASGSSKTRRPTDEPRHLPNRLVSKTSKQGGETEQDLDHLAPQDLRAAAEHGQVDKVGQYLERRPDMINRQDKNLWTALHLATRPGHTQTVARLVEFGADVTVKNNAGQTALELALERHAPDHDVVKVLQKAEKEQVDQASELVRSKRPDDMRGFGAEEPETSSFARKGAAAKKISPRDMRTAADSNDLERVQKAVELQPELTNRGDKNQWTPLHLATRKGHTDIVKVLVSHGADLELKTNRGQTALDVALERLGSTHEITQVLREGLGNANRDVKVTPEKFWHAAEFGKVDDVRSYLENDPELLQKVDSNRWGALHVATRSGQAAMVELLVEFGSNVLAASTDGRIPMDIALELYGPSHAVSSVLRAAEPDDPEEPVPPERFRRAAQFGDLQRIQTYLEREPGLLDQADENQWRALHLAVRSGHTAVVELLIQKGCEVGTRTAHGATCMDLAISFWGVNHDIVTLLRNAEERVVDHAATIEEDQWDNGDEEAGDEEGLEQPTGGVASQDEAVDDTSQTGVSSTEPEQETSQSADEEDDDEDDFGIPRGRGKQLSKKEKLEMALEMEGDEENDDEEDDDEEDDDEEDDDVGLYIKTGPTSGKKLISRKEAVEIALEMDDDEDEADLDLYVQTRRSRFNALGQATSETPDVETSTGDEEEDEDYDSYVEAGRSRLDAILSSQYRDEL